MTIIDYSILTRQVSAQAVQLAVLDAEALYDLVICSSFRRKFDTFARQDREHRLPAALSTFNANAVTANC